MSLYIVERRTFSDTDFHTSYFYYIFHCISFYGYCVLVNIRTAECTWLCLTAINKEILLWWWWREDHRKTVLW